MYMLIAIDPMLLPIGYLINCDIAVVHFLVVKCKLVEQESMKSDFSIL